MDLDSLHKERTAFAQTASVFVHTHTHTHRCTQHTHAHTHTNTHTHIQTHKHTHIYRNKLASLKRAVRFFMNHTLASAWSTWVGHVQAAHSLADIVMQHTRKKDKVIMRVRK
jgi:hypothetical protein